MTIDEYNEKTMNDITIGITKAIKTHNEELQKEAYNKGVDDFASKLLYELESTTLLKDGYYLQNIINPLAEQLKGENDEK